VPDNETDCGLLTALSDTLRVPVFEPFDVGEKVTKIAHFAPGDNDVMLVPHVVPDTVAKLPLIDTLILESVVVPVFVTVTSFAALVVPVSCVPKLKLDAESDACGLITRAVMEMDCGLPAALSVMVRVAVEAVGLKIFAVAKMPTPILQLLPGGSVAGMPEIKGGQNEMSP